jgi:hypothetical protein
MEFKKDTLGSMISQMERQLEECRAAQQIVEKWKFILTHADPIRRKQLMYEILKQLDFPEEEISKIIR